jgi:hypothetical protein
MNRVSMHDMRSEIARVAEIARVEGMAITHASDETCLEAMDDSTCESLVESACGQVGTTFPAPPGAPVVAHAAAGSMLPSCSGPDEDLQDFLT